jgi:hypothetical protein
MSDSIKDPITRFIVPTETVRLTNWSIRTTWKTSAGLIALTTRLFASSVLAIVRSSQRKRFRW